MTTQDVGLERLKRDMDYFEAHREELLEQYPEQWVAIFHEQVLGAGPDFDRLLDDLQARGIPVGQVLIERVTRHDELLVGHLCYSPDACHPGRAHPSTAALAAGPGCARPLRPVPGGAHQLRAPLGP
ncbi:MAG: hypothetical protein HY689_14730 [Chloroflexi bacterium]|nr:hypothetical protein [Chloroflexota bacterium]